MLSRCLPKARLVGSRGSSGTDKNTVAVKDDMRNAPWSHLTGSRKERVSLPLHNKATKYAGDGLQVASSWVVVFIVAKPRFGRNS